MVGVDCAIQLAVREKDLTLENGTVGIGLRYAQARTNRMITRNLIGSYIELCANTARGPAGQGPYFVCCCVAIQSGFQARGAVGPSATPAG